MLYPRWRLWGLKTPKYRKLNGRADFYFSSAKILFYPKSSKALQEVYYLCPKEHDPLYEFFFNVQKLGYQYIPTSYNFGAVTTVTGDGVEMGQKKKNEKWGKKWKHSNAGDKEIGRETTRRNLPSPDERMGNEENNHFTFYHFGRSGSSKYFLSCRDLRSFKL